ncbi:hypothetical protein TNCV_1184591 [Trichonephila clavipes]|nr:hypothetical protein TNCV_1184591 [Trichonephila clavipes]
MYSHWCGKLQSHPRFFMVAQKGEDRHQYSPGIASTQTIYIVLINELLMKKVLKHTVKLREPNTKLETTKRKEKGVGGRKMKTNLLFLSGSDSPVDTIVQEVLLNDPPTGQALSLFWCSILIIHTVSRDAYRISIVEWIHFVIIALSFYRSKSAV